MPSSHRRSSCSTPDLDGAARIGWPSRVAPAALACALAIAWPARADEELRNWFDDPFFQVSSAIADCPLPAGPFVDESDRRQQAHRRAEKGTTCWLARECDRPNAYAYDRDIAAGIEAGLAGNDALARSTLWVTVQGRVVYVEGCVRSDADAVAIEAFARGVAHVQQAMAIVRVGPSAPLPYRRRAR